MAGWSMVANDVELTRLCVDLESVSEGFYTILNVLLKDKCGLDSVCWSFPPMLGDGKSADLLKLFLVVRQNGGYDAVTKNGMWDFVAKESGLDLKIACSVKLVYSKYLNALEKWLERLVDDKESKSKLSDTESDGSGVLTKLGAKFKAFLSEMDDSKCLRFKSELNVGGGEVEDEESMFAESSKSVVDFMDVEKSGDDMGKSGVMDDDSSEGEEKCKGVKKNLLSELTRNEKLDIEDEVKSVVMEVRAKDCHNDRHGDDEDVLELDSASLEELVASRKRKRQSICRMLSWINGIASNPCDPVVLTLPEMAKWKSYGNEEYWKQILSAREVLFSKRDVNQQKNQKMHPCMYDDNVGATYKLRERSKCVKKLDPGKTSSQLPACSQSSSAATQNDSCTEGSCNGDSSAEYSVLDLPANKRIPLGPDFQAEVPELIDVVYESDSKWVGTRIWPLEKVNGRLIIEREPIGKGREDSCGCVVPKSIECVRFHCSERKLRLRRELGIAFHHWKFDKMGEEVKLSWTAAEQEKFKFIVRSNPVSLDKCFWDEIVKHFRYKKRGDLVSYYYNVFLLQRRAQQNRYSPCNVDSDDDDDDETEWESSPGGILYSAKKVQKKSK